MNYAELTEKELQAKIREFHKEGIDAVYLDRDEWNDLNARLNRIFKDRFVAKISDNDLKKKPYIRYMGIGFFIVEEDKGKNTGAPRPGLLRDALYRAFQDTCEVDIKV